MQFRRDINGLRAIAVIVVVLFHFNVWPVSGGFVGVDVFFVLSGFLMTSIIISGLESKKFTLIGFYKSRANRIIPALSFLCLILLVLGWFFLYDGSYTKLASHITVSMSFISNMTYWGEASYFDADSKTKWLLHTWSLSLEWQFYLIYPIFLMTLYKFANLAKISLLILALVITGFLFGLFLSFYSPSAAYYFLPARAWELLLGGLAFLYPMISLSNSTKRISAYLGIILIVVSCIFINENNAWPGYLALLPAIGAYLIILASYQDNWFLNNFLTQSIGKWSYSIYLWHWPFVVYIYSFSSFTLLTVSICIALSTAFGAMSFELIEKHIKNKKLIVLFIPTMIFALFIANFESYKPIRKMSLDVRNEILKKYESYEMDPTGLFEACNASWRIQNTGKPNVEERCISAVEGGIFLWGDSHMGSLSTGLRRLLPPSVPFNQLTSSACAPSIEKERNGTDRYDRGCDYSNKLAFEVIKANQPDVVILGTKNLHELNDWKNTIRILKNNGVKTVLVVGPLPQWKPSLPEVYIHRHLGKDFISDQRFQSQILFSNQFLKNLQKESDNFIFIDILDSLCTNIQEQKPLCKISENNLLMSFDYGHLTLEGSIYINKTLILPIISKDISM